MTLNLPSRFTARLFAFLALMPACTALAEEQDRWFRVELLVFSNEFAHTVEQWEPTPALDYPGAARFLVEPERVETNLAEHDADSVVDEFGRQIITLRPESRDPNATPGSVEPVVNPSDAAADPEATPTVPILPASDDITPVQVRPTPFIALPARQREFRGKAAYMRRSGRYRILFHQTWVQPVGDQTTALPLVLDRSGDTRQWPELQGSVKIYLSRYLHIETNLWLNTPGDYLPGTWRMPPPPLGPPSLIIEAAPVPQLEDASSEWTAAVGETAAAHAGNEELTETELETEPGPEFVAELDVDVDQELESALEPEPVYPYRHAVLLQQKRRMRSTEVHYIDHPLFGVVIKLLPLSDEELQALAAAEAELAADTPGFSPDSAAAAGAATGP